MKNDKFRSQMVSIGIKVGVFVILGVMLITNTGAGDCDCGGNCCGTGSGTGAPTTTTTTVTAGLPVTMTFMASVDSVNDYNGPLTFTVNGVTYNSVDQTVAAKSLDTVTVTYVSGGPPGAAFNDIWYGTTEHSDFSNGPTVTFTLGAHNYNVLFSFEHGNITVNAALDGKPWTGSISYGLLGPDSATGTKVPQSYQYVKVGSYTVNYLSGGPPKARFTDITPANTQNIGGGSFSTFTINFKSNNRLNVEATLDGDPWEGALSFSISGAAALSGTQVNRIFANVDPGHYILNYLSGGPDHAVLKNIIPAGVDMTADNEAVFRLEFISLGDVTVNGTLDNVQWSGPCNYTLTGPVTLTGTTLPQTFSNIPLGDYLLTYQSGGPENTDLNLISPSATQSVLRGKPAQYTLEFASRGTITVTSSMYTSNWNGPCSYEITGNTPNGPVTLSGTEVPFTFTDLPLGQYTLTYLSGGPDSYEYYGVYPSDTLELNQAGNGGKFQIRFVLPQVVVVVPPATADLSITAAGVYTGAAGTYTITVTNSGPVAATGVIVTLTLPPDEDGAGTLFPVSYASDVPSQGVYAAGVWTIGTINNGSTVTLTVNVTIAGGVTLFNNFTATAQVTTSPVPDPDSIPGNNNPAEDDQASATFTS
jgi:hypothetical protein